VVPFINYANEVLFGSGNDAVMVFPKLADASITVGDLRALAALSSTPTARLLPQSGGVA
jgi:hypothetical protein